MIKKITFAILATLALAISASAIDKGCDCGPATLMASGQTEIRWVDTTPTEVAHCKIFDGVAPGQVIEGSCSNQYVQCTGVAGGKLTKCQVRMLVRVVREVVETERRVVVPAPVVRDRIIERPTVHKRTIVRRHRHVERERHTGGDWYPISHRSTMNCWPRGSIPRGQTVSGHCNGQYTRCTGGSLRSGAHRQCSAKR